MDEKVREILEWLKVWGQKEWPPEQQRQAEKFILDLCIPHLVVHLARHGKETERGLIMGALSAKKVGDCFCELMPPGKLCGECLKELAEGVSPGG